MSSFDDRLAQDVEAWIPKEAGDTVQGQVVTVDTRPSDYGEDYPYLEIEKENGTIVSVHAFHTVLKRELGRLGPKEGDYIGIRYAGKEKGRTADYEKYRVLLDRRASEAPEAPNWGAMQADAEGEIEAATELGVVNPLPSDDEPF